MKKKPFQPLILGALALAVLAIFLVFHLINNVGEAARADSEKQRLELEAKIDALSKQSPQVIETNTKTIGQRPVAYARLKIAAGQQITREFLDEKPTPENIVPSGLTIDEVAGKYATRTIEMGDAVTSFNVADRVLTMSTKLTPGYRALALPIYNDSDTNTTGGFAVDGDRVDLLLTYDEPAGSKQWRTQTVMQNIRVLFAPGGPRNDRTDGLVPAPAPGQPQVLSFEVTPDQAEALIELSTMGKLRMVLRSQSDNVIVHSKGFDTPSFYENPNMVEKRSISSEERANDINVEAAADQQKLLDKLKKESEARKKAGTPAATAPNP